MSKEFKEIAAEEYGIKIDARQNMSSKLKVFAAGIKKRTLKENKAILKKLEEIRAQLKIIEKQAKAKKKMLLRVPKPEDLMYPDLQAPSKPLETSPVQQ